MRKYQILGVRIKDHEVIVDFLLRDGKHQIKGRSTEMEDEDTGLLGNLPHVQVGGEPKTMARREDKEKNQVTTLAGKEGDSDSTATRTTATFTSCCES